MHIRDRIRELRRVPANQLRPNPRNWRVHPESQHNALRALLAEIGMATAVLARELDDGSLMLIDGHLRTETLGSEIVPVLVLDVDEQEANKLLVTLDPLASMAEANTDELEALIQELDFENDTVTQMVENVLNEAIIDATSLDAPEAAEQEEANPYTAKVAVPPYEISGPKPDLSAIYDVNKCNQLIAEIKASDIPEDEKKFLIVAAYRHAVFNYQEIANYYAHSDAEVQQLMENSGLVIVDMDSAIRNGWTRLENSLNEIYADEKGGDDEQPVDDESEYEEEEADEPAGA